MNLLVPVTRHIVLLLAPAVALLLLFNAPSAVQAATLAEGTKPQTAQPPSLSLIPAQKIKPDGEYVVYIQKGDEWKEIGILSFDKFFSERKMDLGEFVSVDEPARIRLVQQRGGAAHVDAVHLGGLPPVEVKGSGEILAMKKLAKKDFDLLDAYGKTLDLLFPANGPDRTLSLVARVEGLRITETPFHYPVRNLYQKMTPDSAFYSYKLGDSKIVAPPADGRLKAGADPFFKEWSVTGTGHPSGYTYGWVANDDENLYVKIDFTSDDTMDGENDYSKVYVKTGAGLREFKITSSETRWGVVDFAYTDKADYQHKVYDFKIPFRELGIRGAAEAKDIQLAFAAYGTSAPAAYEVVAVNPVTNKIYLANRTSSVVTVIDGATGATATVTAGNGPAAIAVNVTTNKVYVANYGDGSAPGTVTVIDGATNNTTQLTVGTAPMAIAVNAAINKVYVANYGDGSAPGTVTVIDGTNNNVVATPTVGIAPWAIAVNPVTNRVYVANSGAGSVTVIDGANNVIGTPTVGTSPWAVAINPVTNKVYVANFGSSDVSVIDGSDNSVAAPVTTGSGPAAIAVNPVTNMVYVANYYGGNFTVIDGANNPTTVPLGLTPMAVAINSTTNRIYVATSSGSVALIDGVSNAFTLVSVGADLRTVAVNPVTNKAYVANYDTNNVIVIDGATNIASNVNAGAYPYAAAYNPVSNKVYVSNSGAGNVTIINAATGGVIANATVGSYPQGIAVNPVNNKVYVADNSDSTVSVIDGATDTVIDTLSLAGGTSPEGITVNPVTGKVYTANYGSTNGVNGVTVIDTNNANTTSTITTGARPIAIAVNPVTNRIYVANYSGSSVTVIDGATAAVIGTVTVGANPYAIAINPITNRIYVANYGSNYVTEINGADNVPATIAIGHKSRAIAVNPLTNRIYAAKLAGTIVTVINGSDNSFIPVTVGTNPYAVAVNPVTNKIYSANYGSANVTVIDGLTNAAVNVPVGTQPQSLAINLLNNRIYTANYGSADGTDGVTVIEEQAPQAIPLDVAITPLAGNASALSTPTFSFTTASSFAPTAPPVRKVYYQLDTWQGAWKEATAFAANAGSVIAPFPLSIGNHTLYMFAVDGQEATSSNTGFQSSPVIGSIAGYNFIVTGSALSVDTGSLTFDGIDDLVGIPGASYSFPNGGFTVEAWIKPSSLVAGADFKAIVSSPGDWVLFLNSSNPAYWGLSVCVPGCNAAESPANAILSVDKWQHIAATFDGKVIKIFLNGSQVASQAHVGSTYIASDLVIAKWVESFHGTISEVRIWDSVHDAAAIQAIKEVALTGGETGLIGYWRLNEGYGVTVADSSPRNNTGYLGGVPLTGAYTPIWGAHVPVPLLSASTSGTGTGSVASAPAGIACGATCSGNYGSGTVVTLTATPNAGSVFTGWTGGGCSGTGTCLITLTADTNITAQFDAIALSTQFITGFTPPGTATYGDTPITLSAAASSGLPVTFSVTSGPGTLSGNLLTITGAGDITITANQAGNSEYGGAPQVSLTLKVDKALPAIDWSIQADLGYGTALSATQLNAVANVSGSFSYSPAAGTMLGVGMHAMSVAFIPTDTANYANATRTVTITVLPTGKIAGDGSLAVTITDALKALKIAVGLISPTAADLANGDVAPLVNGRPSPNGIINVGDAILILQKSLGIVSW